MAKPPPTDPVVPTTEITEETAGLDGTPSIIGRVKKYFGFFRQEDKIRPVTLVSALKYNKTTQQFYEHDHSPQKVFEDLNDGANSTLVKTVLDAMNTYYNTYNLNDVGILGGVTVAYDNTSQQEDTLTAPAGHVYIVFECSMVNNTRVFSPILEHTLASGTKRTLNKGSASAGAGLECPMMSGIVHGASTYAYGINKPFFILGAGDALVMHDAQFQASDSMEFYWIYLDVTL